MKNTIQYDSKSKHSKRRQTVNWTWEVACWFSFFLFWKSRQLRIRQHAHAYGFVFERHQRSDFFVEKLYGMRARALARRCGCACPLARGRPRRLLLSPTRRQRRKVDKCRVADKKQTDKHTLLFYRYRLDWALPSYWCNFPTAFAPLFNAFMAIEHMYACHVQLPLGGFDWLVFFPQLDYCQWKVSLGSDGRVSGPDCPR